MEIDEYLRCDPDTRILNKSLIQDLTASQLHTQMENKIKQRGNALLRQEINDHTPEYTPKCISFYQLLFSIICFSLGFPMVLIPKNQYYEIRYDDW